MALFISKNYNNSNYQMHLTNKSPLFSRIKYRHSRPKLISISRLLHYFAKVFSKNKEVSCVQVGANDGIHYDPIHRYLIEDGWQGLLIEPLEDVFNKELKNTYKNLKSVRLVNAAIDEQSGKKEIYRISFCKEFWASGLSTFNKQSLINNIKNGYVDNMAKNFGVATPNDIEDYITTETIKTYSFEDLFKECNITRVDTLVIDTEGSDFKILQMFDFSKYKPDLILFESSHLSNEILKESTNYLKDFGYHVFWERGDTIAISDKVCSQLGFFKLMLWRFSAFLSKL